MDPISQGALGALVSSSAAKPETVRKAALIGWAGGMLADADIFIRSADDPLLNIEYHRHFSHSLLFVPLGALLCALVFWVLTRQRWKWPFSRYYAFSFAGYATAGLLDACTSYGTQLFWPFSNARVAWNIISIVDPVFTGALLILLAVALTRKRLVWVHAGLVFVVGYLTLGVIQRERTLGIQQRLAEERGHQNPARQTVKPSLGNLVLWRSLYLHDGHYHVDAIRTGLFSQPQVYKGVAVPALALRDLQQNFPENSILAKDLERFAHFSDNYLAWHPDQPDVLNDLRYAALPNSVLPLWGIRIDPSRPDQHVPFESFREMGAGERERFMRMLKGNPQPKDDSETTP